MKKRPGLAHLKNISQLRSKAISLEASLHSLPIVLHMLSSIGQVSNRMVEA